MMTLHTRPPLSRTLLLAFSIFQALLLASGALADEESRTCESKPLIVKIHADWCTSCRAAQQTWDKVVTDLADEVTAITFDVSDRLAHQASAAEAKRLGISEFFQEYDRKTGVIAVLDCNTRIPSAIFAGERDFEKLRDDFVPGFHP